VAEYVAPGGTITQADAGLAVYSKVLATTTPPTVMDNVLLFVVTDTMIGLPVLLVYVVPDARLPVTFCHVWFQPIEAPETL
jgi:hypothetical protein